MQKFTLITGATSGIGLELAKIAAREKRNLVLIARSKSKLEELRDQILRQAQNDTQRVEIMALDLSKSTSVQKLFAFCEKSKIFIDELINNAGFGDYGTFAQSDVKRQLTMIDLNIRSLTELTHLLLPAMMEQKTGRIMNLGSVASFLPGPLMSVYFASKNYVLSFSRALHEELRGCGVSVTCLCPGATQTNFGKNAQVSETHSTANPKVTAREVAEFGWYHMQAGDPIAIYGRGNRTLLQIVKFIPRNLLTRLIKHIQK
ncbi:MAG: SDR family oxidoreductase [Candidatus Saccharimonadales bacterium]